MALIDWFRRPAPTPEPTLEERAVIDRSPIGQPPGGAQAYISTYADTGRSITPEAAREAPTVYACTRLISQSVARMEWRVMRREGGIPVPAREHPLYRLLNIEPNPYMGAMVWRESMLLDCLLYGNAYAVIERDAVGRVVGLHKLRADSVEVSRGPDGMPVYSYTSARWGVSKSTDQVWQAYDIFHLRAPSLDGLLGETPIYLVRNIIGVELEAEKFVASFFRNGARPAGLIKVTGTLTEEALKRLRQSWQSITGGAENAGRVAILESGYSWEKVSVDPEEAKLVELRSFCRSQIAAAFNVPVHMVGDATKTSYASAEQADAEFVKHCLANWASRFEEECARKLVREGEPIETHISFDALLRGDLASRFAAYSTALNNGFLTINEVRERENYAPIDGGDMARAPVNLAIVDPNAGKSGDQSPLTAPAPVPATAPAPATAPMARSEGRCSCEGWMEMLAAFDDSTRACIEDKIPTLLDEGYPQDQAVAIAISKCSEGRSVRNCGTGEGGFQEGNDCAGGGGEGGGDGAKPAASKPAASKSGKAKSKAATGRRRERLRDRIEGTQAEADREVNKVESKIKKTQAKIDSLKASTEKLKADFADKQAAMRKSLDAAFAKIMADFDAKTASIPSAKTDPDGVRKALDRIHSDGPDKAASKAAKKSTESKARLDQDRKRVDELKAQLAASKARTQAMREEFKAKWGKYP
jgi:HK97 family phage portal protein